MNIVEKPIAAIIGRLTSTGDGIHMIANSYKKGVRLHTHMHREAQLVYAAKGTMQVTTPKGRWLVPPDRAVWVPALSEHAIDVLADIEMRTLYFELDWLQREVRSHSLNAEFVVRVSPLLHQTILALFDDRATGKTAAAAAGDDGIGPGDSDLPLLRSHAAAAPPTSCWRTPRPTTRSRAWRARSAPRCGRCRGCSRRRRN
jgi:quercetin dioxygenase-like cupin family protein